MKKERGKMLLIKADASPFEGFLKLLKLSADSGKFRIDPRLGIELPKDIIRCESVHGPAGAREMTVVFYPSDALLRYAGALSARQPDLHAV